MMKKGESGGFEVKGWAAMDDSGVLSPFNFTRRKTRSHDVAFKVAYCGICHSDLHQSLNLYYEEAENGKVAVDYFKQGRTYDIVLMDKEMPVMDGHEATRQLRSMGVKTPIVALTANTLQSDKDLFFEAGVDDFQSKPLSRARLVQLLDQYGVDGCAGNRRG